MTQKRLMIEQKITDFVSTYQKLHHTETHWRSPVIGVADALDPLYRELKEKICHELYRTITDMGQISWKKSENAVLKSLYKKRMSLFCETKNSQERDILIYYSDRPYKS